MWRIRVYRSDRPSFVSYRVSYSLYCRRGIGSTTERVIRFVHGQAEAFALGAITLVGRFPATRSRPFPRRPPAVSRAIRTFFPLRPRPSRANGQRTARLFYELPYPGSVLFFGRGPPLNITGRCPYSASRTPGKSPELFGKYVVNANPTNGGRRKSRGRQFSYPRVHARL